MEPKRKEGISMIRSVKQELTGWGKYPKIEGHVYRPENIEDIQELFSAHPDRHYIARGLGRSYGDTALSEDGLILMTRLNHFISFDPTTGVLEAEAGVSLEDISKTFVPQGFFLPVTPGTKFITLGGAIANDVHGKNHHVDGCFSNFVISFTLMLANGDIIECSREQNEEIFWATVGGIGLTGLILTVKLKLRPIETAYIEVTYRKAKNIYEALEMFSETDDHYQYSVAWIDCLSTGNSLGRSVLMQGNHATEKKLAEYKNVAQPLWIKPQRKLTVPFELPSFTLNYWTIKAFNAMYSRLYKDGTTKIESYDKYFYPLDGVNHWNRAYGRKGFIQYQVVLPPETSKEALIEMLKRFSQTKRSSFLAVLKSSGAQNQGMLSFPFSGHTLALDIPIRNNHLFSFLKEMDEWVLQMGGRIYLAKDSLVSPEHFALMYPRLSEFKEIIRSLDPNERFASAMSKRLGITGAGR
jgi:FAD/FMN-containing dehydrogenase